MGERRGRDGGEAGEPGVLGKNVVSIYRVGLNMEYAHTVIMSQLQ